VSAVNPKSVITNEPINDFTLSHRGHIGPKGQTSNIWQLSHYPWSRYHSIKMTFSDIQWGTHTATYILLVFNSIAAWSCVPLTLRMYATLKDRRSLYFRAMLVSSWGLSLRATSYFCTYFASRHIPWYVTGMASQIGWICMVSGLALVLWSRLSFILSSEQIKRYLLWMICFNGAVFHTIMTVLGMTIWGMNDNIAHGHMKYKIVAARIGAAQNIFECIQIVFFNGQEILISSFYIRAAYVYLRDWGALGVAESRRKVRRSMMLLLVIQAFVVCIDVAIITIDLMHLLQLKGMIHSFVYCLKLEVEFVVLNQLVEISKLGLPGLPSTSQGSGVPEVVQPENNPRGETDEGSWRETVKVFNWDVSMQLRHEWINPCDDSTTRQPRAVATRDRDLIEVLQAGPP
jgi:hypothetical protein